jgi:hypothetical protein
MPPFIGITQGYRFASPAQPDGLLSEGKAVSLRQAQDWQGTALHSAYSSS